MTVLSQARAMRYEIATNLKGQGMGAVWTMLLPTLEVDTVALVGRETPAALAAIDLLAAARIDLSDPAALEELGERRVDVVVVGPGAAKRGPDLSAMVERLAADGAIYAEAHGGQGIRDIAGTSITRFNLWPAYGPARVFVPSDDRDTAGRLGRLGFLPARGSTRLMSRVRARLTEPMQRVRSQRRADLAVRGSLATHGPPAYVVRIARAAGVDIGSAPWALVAPGDYPSQKVLLLLFDPVDGEPWTVVKLGLHRAHADRLRNEVIALKQLAHLDLPEGSVPALRFAGEHAGRGVVAQSWIHGRPFTAAATSGISSPELAAATKWLTVLASSSSDRRASGEVGEALRDLFARFTAIYGLAEEESRFLHDQVRAIQAHHGSIPVVFSHGDPGVRNLLVGDGGRVSFLDWESAERHGPPLWDLFHLQWSFGEWASRSGGERRRHVASVRHLTNQTDLMAHFADQIAAQAQALDVPRSLIAPLFYTAWMHRSLKEATRRTRGNLDRGPYLRTLRELIRRRDDASAQRLLSVDR